MLPNEVIVLGVALAAAVGVFLLIERGRVAKLNEMFENLASIHGGWVTRGGLFRNPVLNFPYGEGVAELRVIHRRRGLELTLRADLPLNFTIACGGAWWLWRPRHYVRSGVPALDSAFTVTSLEPEKARAMLASAGSQLVVLAGGDSDQSLRIDLEDGVLTFRRRIDLSHRFAAELLLRRMLEFYDQAQLPFGGQIAFVEPLSPAFAENGNCPVCGDSLAQPVVACGRCHTPHHRDCWKYNGVCARYACGHQSYYRPNTEPKGIHV